MKKVANLWKKISSRQVYDNPWINVEEHQVLNPAGKPGIYGKVHFKNKAIGIIPINEKDETWLVGQYRYTLDVWSWEIPEGGGALSTDPLISAKRELKEETGLEAEKWTKIGQAHLSNSVSDEEGILFVAENLTEGRSEREDTEADMKIKKVHLKDAVDMVIKGEITDSLSVIGLLMVARIKGY
ncbi:MAG: NUDIX hydrolase [Cyclobacteriaceae bacterium]|nr:NUDIX hydrolase [Cyclobacteriaceae bacterium]